MRLSPNPFLSALRQGKPHIGLWLSLSSQNATGPNLQGQPMLGDVWAAILHVAKRLIGEGSACGSDTGLLARGSDRLLASMASD